MWYQGHTSFSFAMGKPKKSLRKRVTTPEDKEAPDRDPKVLNVQPRKAVTGKITVGELRSGATGFTKIFATGLHQFLLQVCNDERDEINLRQIKKVNLTYHWHMYVIISPWNILELCRTCRWYIATKKQQIVTLKVKKLRNTRQKLIISNFDDNWRQQWACGCRHLSIHLLSMHLFC